MWKHQEPTNLLTRLVLIFVFIAHLLVMTGALSDKRLCADPNCKEIISMGTGKINYPAGEKGMVSFKINSPIRIKSKGAGIDPSLWGIEVNGREGYAPKKFILETKVLISDKKLEHIVDVNPKIAVPTLTTSEKLVERENTIETVTTEPLNFVPTNSTENPLKNSSDEKLTLETTPVATPVMTEIVDGTEIPIFKNDLDATGKFLNENVEPLTTIETKPETEYDAEGDQQITETIDSDIEIVSKSSEALNTSIKDIDDHLDKEQNGSLEKEIETVSTENDSTKEENNFENVREPDKSIESTNDFVQKHENKQTKKESVISAALEKEILSESPAEESNTDLLSSSESRSDETTEYKNQLDSKLSENENQAQNSNHDTKPEQILSENSQHSPIEIEKTEKELDGNRIAEKLQDLSSAKEVNNQLINNNLTDSSNDIIKTVKGQEVSINNKSLYLTAPTLVDFNSKVQNDNAADPVDQQEVSANQEPEIQMETNNINIATEGTRPYEANLLKVEAEIQIETNNINIETEGTPPYEANFLKVENGESLKSSNADKQVNTSSYVPETTNANLNTTLPEIVDHELETAKGNIDSKTQTLQTKKHSSETEIYNEDVSADNEEKPPKENETNNIDNQRSNNVHINVKNVGGMADMNNGNPNTIKNSNDDNSNNEQKVQTDKVISQIPYQEFKTDKQKEVDDISRFSGGKEDLTLYAPTEEKLSTDLVENPNLDEKQKSPKGTHTGEEILNTTPENYLQIKKQSQEDIALEDIKPTLYIPKGDTLLNTPLPTEYQELTTNAPSNDNYVQQSQGSEEHLSSFDEQTTRSYNDIPALATETVSQSLQKENEQPKTLPSPTPPTFDNYEAKENKGLFATIMGTVNNVLSINKKNKQNEYNGNQELDGILFLNNKNEYNIDISKENIIQYCKNIGPNGECPEAENNHEPTTAHSPYTATNSILSSDLNLDTFLKTLAAKILENSDFLAFLVIVATSTLFFIFGYYCFCNSSREGSLLLKLNQLESSLLASHKENAILKHNLMSTRQKLASIEDNSFGSNDMVVSLRKELEEELTEKARLQEQITVLQKELENAADAGIELNKIVSELLSNQTGDESIISSVEELQKQLNEQQNTIYEINASLAEKSRENSELQLLIAEQNARYETELADVQRDNDELEHEKGNLLTRIDEMKNDFDKDITAALEGKNLEIKRLQNEIVELTNKLEIEHTKWQTSVAKIEALEECLKNVRKDPHVNIAEVINVANVKAQLIETQNKYKFLKERLETELDSRKSAENQLEMVSAEVEKLKQDFNLSEKDKLEAQTRLEVLSNYFKDKENQLQKELSLKEAMWLKQQGETTTTVDRVTAMQEEIQSLKSQNDSLRAEIEAQVAAHKAQTGTLENRAHETWLAARQSDRRYEEARAEATALRRQLTALAGGNVNEANKPTPIVLGDELTQAPSPIHMESPGSPMLGRMPPPPFLPPPFMGPPPPFMGMPPPPPFVPPGEMRPAPLGRIMSPPPQRSGRFSPQHLDYEDYIDYDGNNTWHRHTYSPPPRTYRSLSPTDSRYNYGTERDLLSTYDTETDFSPPPSPRESRRRGGNSSERIDSNTKISYGNTKKFNTSNKGPLSSGSEKSFNTPSHNNTKTKKGNQNHGGKTLV